MSVRNIAVTNQSFGMTQDEIISFEFDFTKLIPNGVNATGEQSRIIRTDTGKDVSLDCLGGLPQRDGNIVKQVVLGILKTVTYVLVLSIELSNSNVRSASITIEGANL